jgi:hypothetical protein
VAKYQVASKEWKSPACASIALCVLLLVTRISALADSRNVALRPPPASDGISRRWLYDSWTGQWKPVGPFSPVDGLAYAEVAGCQVPISTAPSWQLNPVVAWNSERDEFLVVWEDTRSGTGIDIYGQRMDAEGALLGDNLSIVVDAQDQRAPSLFYKSVDGEYLLLWQHRQRNAYEIRGQRLSATGTPLGVPFRVSASEGGTEWIPGAAYNDVSNELLVAWEDTSTSDIVAQRISGEGDLLGPPLSIANWLEAQWAPPLVTFSNVQQEYLVVWDALALGDVYGQFVAADGSLRGENMVVVAQSGAQFVSDVVYCPASDEYLAVWTDERAMAKRGSDIYGQRIAANGALVGEELPISEAPQWQRDGRLAYDPIQEEYLVVWWDGRNAEIASDIYAQRMSPHGLLFGPNMPVSASATDQIVPQLAARGASGQYAIVWQEWHDTDREEGDSDVCGMIYAPPRFFVWIPWLVQGSFSAHSPT